MLTLKTAAGIAATLTLAGCASMPSETSALGQSALDEIDAMRRTAGQHLVPIDPGVVLVCDASRVNPQAHCRYAIVEWR